MGDAETESVKESEKKKERKKREGDWVRQKVRRRKGKETVSE